MDYRRMYDDTGLLYAYDLEGTKGDVVVVIESVKRDELTGNKGRKAKKPHVSFVGKEKRLALNKTNGKTISRMYGKDVDDWIGKPIALYVTTTEMDGEVVDCIRIRSRPPETQQRGGGHKNGGQGNRGRAAPPAGDGQQDLTEQIRDRMAADAAGRKPRDPGDTMEPDEQERAWLAEAGHPRGDGDTMELAEFERQIIEEAERKAGIRK